MCKYVLSEVSKALKTRATYFYIAGMVLLSIMANLSMIAFRMIYGIVDGSFGYNLIIFAEGCFIIPYFSTIFIADIVFGPEYPNPHIKTKITNGLSRTKIYLGKFVAQILLAACFVIVAVVLFIGITYLFMASDGTIDEWTIEDFCQKVLFSIPLWVAGLAFGNMYLFIFRRKLYAYIAFFVTVVAVPRLIMLFGAQPFEWTPFVLLRQYVLLTPRFSELQYLFTQNEYLVVALSAVYTVIALFIGWKIFRDNTRK